MCKTSAWAPVVKFTSPTCSPHECTLTIHSVLIYATTHTSCFHFVEKNSIARAGGMEELVFHPFLWPILCDEAVDGQCSGAGGSQPPRSVCLVPCSDDICALFLVQKK
eukprot:RCo043872